MATERQARRRHLHPPGSVTTERYGAGPEDELGTLGRKVWTTRFMVWHGTNGPTSDRRVAFHHQGGIVHPRRRPEATPKRPGESNPGRPRSCRRGRGEAPISKILVGPEHHFWDPVKQRLLVPVAPQVDPAPPSGPWRERIGPSGELCEARPRSLEDLAEIEAPRERTPRAPHPDPSARGRTRAHRGAAAPPRSDPEAARRIESRAPAILPTRAGRSADIENPGGTGAPLLGPCKATAFGSGGSAGELNQS